MIGQQRNVLAAIGIDVWIPRDVVCQKNTASSIWRDQAVEETQQIPQMSFETETLKPEIQTNEVQSQKIKQAESPQVEIAEQAPVQKAISEKEQVVVSASVQAFELQMYVLENSAILVESSQLNDEQRQLWRNIQKAKLGQYAELKWPFPLAGFQESRGLSSYIQGFLDASANNKKILCLGQLDFLQHSNLLYLASLEEMIAQPLLKKRLWQLMQ
ncbi:hypothetical protein [Acinetobacter venetianus]|uniref:Uncharacterized protein n=1 Tax=Acinetobacter venetianus TaxID=52133 RepID=A0A150HU96_9GAMM|nr:hypothetical protein [Acinetobacter venetianus]KXZ70278.1 hypothetical protein AVENLUH13518_01902 [Acinetobacter venetianus]